jgi:hypothetical protein
MDKEPVDGADVRVVHREALSGVVQRRSKPPELAHDDSAVLLQPAPRPLDERLTTQFEPVRPFLQQLALDHRVHGDGRVVVTRLPQRVEPTHAVPAHEHVLRRGVERVAHVQVAGDVRRWQRDRVRLVAARPGAGPVEALLLPGALPRLFDALGPVEGVHGAGL